MKVHTHMYSGGEGKPEEELKKEEEEVEENRQHLFSSINNRVEAVSVVIVAFVPYTHTIFGCLYENLLAL